MIKIPQNNKFKKYNRKCIFKNTKLMHYKNENFVLSSPYAYGLVALESGSLDFIQIRALYNISSKGVKERRALRKRPKKLAEEACDNSFSVSHIFKNANEIINSSKNDIYKKLKKSRRFKKGKISLGVAVRFATTAKPLGIRMGKGKGEINFWHTPVKKGLVILQIRKDVKPLQAIFTLKQIQYRIPFNTKIVCKDLKLSNYLFLKKNVMKIFKNK